MLDSIAKYIGYSLVALAILNLSNFFNLDSVYLMGLSLAALFFVICDLLEVKADEKGDPFKYRRSRITLYFLSVSSFIVIPNASFNWNAAVINKVNEFSILMSIGLIFYIMGTKQEKVASENLTKIIDEKINDYVKEYSKNEVPKLVDNLLDKDFIRNEAIKTIKEIEDKRNRNIS